MGKTDRKKEDTMRKKENGMQKNGTSAVKGYFDKVVKGLKGASGVSDEISKLDFVTLKGYEYWYRYIKTMKADDRRPDLDDAIAVLPYENALKVISSVGEHLEKVCLRERRKIDAKLAAPTAAGSEKRSFEINLGDCGVCIDEDEDEDDADEDECGELKLRFFKPSADEQTLKLRRGDGSEYTKRFRAVRDMQKLFEKDDAREEMQQLVSHYMHYDAIFGSETKKVFYEAMGAELLSILENAECRADEPFFRRVSILKETYGLDDEETEVVVFSWVFLRKKICGPVAQCCVSGGMRFDERAFGTCYSTVFRRNGLDRVLRADGTLRKMRILNNEFKLSSLLCGFLRGAAGDDLDSVFFRIYDGPSVPYARLAQGNPKVEMFYQLLKHAQPGQALNLFLYGVEGTGKTELVKAVARKLKRPLVLTNVSTLGGNRESREDGPIQSRLARIAYAAHRYRGKKAVLLVDEADLILNGCEKGALNFFLEELNIPIVWISNNIGCVEASTKRRFDFSLKFMRLDAEKRLSVWRSVVKAQKAEGLLTDDELERISAELPVAAGGATQAIAGALRLKKAGVKTPAAELVRTIAEGQLELLGLDREFRKRDTETHAPGYSLEVLNIDDELDRVERVVRKFDERWKEFREGERPESLNVLLYGPPGTGKTEYARHLARKLDRKLLIKRASDLLDPYVGMTEKNISAMFREAEEKKAILFLDEADSMLRDRAGARQSWEATHVNELLTQMENFTGIFVAATNFEKSLDDASNRRFAIKLKFGFLKPEGIRRLWEVFFPGVPVAEEALSLPNLAPGDFNAVHGAFRWHEESEVTQEAVLKALRREIDAKKGSSSVRRMGL